jgi:hypothetical protein
MNWLSTWFRVSSSSQLSRVRWLKTVAVREIPRQTNEMQWELCSYLHLMLVRTSPIGDVPSLSMFCVTLRRIASCAPRCSRIFSFIRTSAFSSAEACELGLNRTSVCIGINQYDRTRVTHHHSGEMSGLVTGRHSLLRLCI